MKYQKNINLLGNIPDKVPRLITKKWIEVNDPSGTGQNRYKTSKQIKFKIPMLRSHLCDFSAAYIVVTGKIIVANPNNNAYDKKLAFKNNALFISCISKINNTLVDNTEDLDVVMPMDNLIEFSKNYRKATGSLWNYYRDERNSGFDINNNRDKINYSIKDSESFNYKISIAGKLENGNEEKDGVKIVVPLKYLSNFWRTINIPLINCEVSLDLHGPKIVY